MFFKRKNAVSKIIVGLGNPGRQYEKTRHNAGFMALDVLCDEFNASLKKIRFKSFTDTVSIENHSVLLMAPQTYMNLSGEAVKMAMDYYSIEPKDIITISDDIELELGVVRIRRKGSHGGQKGLKDIYHFAKTNEIPRIKIGVGKKPHPDYDTASWVLSKFSDNELKIINNSLKNIGDIIKLMVSEDIEKAMNLYSK